VTSGLRSLRFVHPDVDLDAPAAGLVTTASGAVAMVDGDASVRQALMLLLSTAPGERVMRPDYGCPLHRLVFQPLDETTGGLAIHYVEQAVRRWEPRVELLAVDAGPLPEHPDALLVHLRYRVRATRIDAELTVTVDLAGGRR
jgi:uncharacterized protein